VNLRQRREHLHVIARLAVALTALLLLEGCFYRPMLSFDLASPPQITVPAALAGVVDGRARFREIWCAIRQDHGKGLPEDRPCEEVLVRFAGEGTPSGRMVFLGPASGALRIVVVPGMLGECFRASAVPFGDALAHLATYGYRGEVLWVSGRSSSSHNARQVRDAVMEQALADGERLLLVGHSKGAVDILEALAGYPEIAPRVAAVVSVAGAVNGSPLIEGLYRSHAEFMKRFPFADCDVGDRGAFDSLRPTRRLQFLATATLPSSVRYFSVVGVVEEAETTWSLRTRWKRLAEIDPRNDGQLLWSDAIIPGSTLLGYVRADHLAIALPFSRNPATFMGRLVDQNRFPREVLLEAVVRTVEETLAAPGAASARP